MEGVKLLVGGDEGNGREGGAVEVVLFLIGRRKQYHGKVFTGENFPGAVEDEGGIGVQLIEQRIVDHAIQSDQWNEVVVT